jgi:hypothetical protein
MELKNEILKENVKIQKKSHLLSANGFSIKIVQLFYFKRIFTRKIGSIP